LQPLVDRHAVAAKTRLPDFNDKDKVMKDMFFFLLGAAVGAIFALLFAPQSGEDLRANIQSTAEKDWHKLQAEWKTGMEKTNASLDQMQSDLKKVLQKQGQADSETATTS